MATFRNLYYITFEPSEDDPTYQAELQKVKENVHLSYKFWSVKADSAVKNKTESGELTKDEVGRANYKLKVISYLARNTPWIVMSREQTQTKTFQTTENKFHEQLVTTFAEGLDMPKSIMDQFENFLTDIKSNIERAMVPGVREDPRFHISLVVYEKDYILGTYLAKFRSFYLTVDKSLSSYIQSKSRGSPVNASIDIQYVQTDGSLNNGMFEGNTKESVQTLVQGQPIAPTDEPEIFFDEEAEPVRAMAGMMKRLEGKRIRGSDVHIYLVLDQLARHIGNGTVYDGIFGNNQNIRTVSQDLLNRMPKGPAIIAAPPLVKPPTGDAIYLIDEGKKRHVQDMKTFGHYGLVGDRIVRIDLDQYPEGPAIRI